VIRAGEPLQVPSAGGASAELVGPTGHRQTVPATSGMFALPPLTRAGVYELKTPAGSRMITVRPADPPAGRIRPGEAPAKRSVAGADTGGRGPEPGRPLLAQLPVWPWLVLGAIGVMSGEWALATRRRGGDA